MRIPWIAACSMLIGCAAQTSGPDLSKNGTAPSPAITADAREVAAAAGSDAPSAASSVPTVAIESFADVATCHRYVATGTRIAGRRCEPNEQTRADRIEYEQARQDLEAMRAQQIYQEQARQQARAEAMRRAAGGR